MIWIIEKLIDLGCSTANDILITSLRNIISGDFSQFMISFQVELFTLINRKISWVLNQSEIAIFILLKTVRLYSPLIYC